MARTRTVFHLKRTGDYGTLFPPVTVTTDEMEPLTVTNFSRIENSKRYLLTLSDGRPMYARHFATFEQGRLFQTEEQVWPEIISSWILIDFEGRLFPPIRHNTGEGDQRNEKARKPEAGPAA
jgi:hypothetical protein